MNLDTECDKDAFLGAVKEELGCRCEITMVDRRATQQLKSEVYVDTGTDVTVIYESEY